MAILGTFKELLGRLSNRATDSEDLDDSDADPSYKPEAAANDDSSKRKIVSATSLSPRIWPSNNDVNVDKDKPGGPGGSKGHTGNGASDAHAGEAGEHWFYRNKNSILKYGGAAAVGTGAVLAAPMVLSAAGFGATGIAAASLGAGMMSKAATTGMGMAVVSSLQSAGAAGIGASTSLLIGGSVSGGIVLAAGNENKGGSSPTTRDAATNTETTPGAATFKEDLFIFALII